MSTFSSLFDLDTELSAVNSILGSIGQAPITDLEFANPEVAFVYRIFQDTVIDVVSEGWSFNSFRDVETLPDDEGYILIPQNFLRVDASNNSYDRNSDYIVLGGRLYDKYNQTDVFTESVYLSFILGSEWSDIPTVFKRYIIARASVRAATQLVTNPQLVQLLAQQEAYLRASCLETECEQGDYSYFGNGSGTTYRSYQPFNALNRF